jgi:hypothetical protein
MMSCRSHLLEMSGPRHVTVLYITVIHQENYCPRHVTVLYITVIHQENYVSQCATIKVCSQLSHASS